MVDDWEEVKIEAPKEKKELTKGEQVEKMAAEILEELSSVHQAKYELEKAKRTAALALQVQMELAEFLSDAELRAKTEKRNLECIEGIVYFECKEKSDKKFSESALQQLVAKNDRVLDAKTKLIESEKEFKKWQYIFNIMKDAHIFFRNLGNGKNDW